MSTCIVLFIVFIACLQAKDERSAMEEKYRNELNAHVKLSSLYKVRITAWHLGYIRFFL